MKKISAIALLALAVVLALLTIIDFSWKCTGLTVVFLLGYLITGAAGIIKALEAKNDLPSWL